MTEQRPEAKRPRGVAKAVGVAFLLTFIPFAMTMCTPACAAPAAYVLCGDLRSYDLEWEHAQAANNRQSSNFRLRCQDKATAEQPGVPLTYLTLFLVYLPLTLVLVVIGRRLAARTGNEPSTDAGTSSSEKS